jgi:hypothetical protein
VARERKPSETDEPLPEGCDEIDVRICQIVEEAPWKTNIEIGEQVGLSDGAMRARRKRACYLRLFVQRNAPQKLRWKEELKPKLRRRLADIASSDDDGAAIKLAQLVMPNEIRPDAGDAGAQDEAAAARADLDRSLADWIRGGSGRPGRAGRTDPPARKARRQRRSVAA